MWGTRLIGWVDALAVRRGTALVLLFLGAGLLLTYPLAASLGSALPGNLGDPLLNAWTLGWGAQWLGGGRHVWDAPIFLRDHVDRLQERQMRTGQVQRRQRNLLRPVHLFRPKPVLNPHVDKPPR